MILISMNAPSCEKKSKEMEDWMVKAGRGDGRKETFHNTASRLTPARKIMLKSKYLWRILFLVCFNTTKRCERNFHQTFSIGKALVKMKVSNERRLSNLKWIALSRLANKRKWWDWNASLIIFNGGEYQAMSGNGWVSCSSKACLNLSRSSQWTQNSFQTLQQVVSLAKLANFEQGKFSLILKVFMKVITQSRNIRCFFIIRTFWLPSKSRNEQPSRKTNWISLFFICVDFYSITSNVFSLPPFIAMMENEKTF